MKRIIALILVACICTISFAACGSKKSSRKDGDYYFNGTYDYDLSEYITLGDYHNLEVNYAIKEATDADVQTKIDAAISEKTTNKEITDRAAQNGDILDINYAGTKDGVAFQGGTAEGAALTIGASSYIAGFEDNFVGKNIGEEFSFDITFPDNYGNEELAGQAVTFTCKVNSISEEVVPEFNDDFVAALEIEDVATVDEYKEYLMKEAVKEAEETTEENKKSAVWSAIYTDAEVLKYPDDELKETIEKSKAQLEAQLTQYSMTVDDYIEQYCEGSEDTYNSQIEENAKNTVKSDMIFFTLVRDMEVNLTDDEYDEGLNKYFDMYASSYGVSTPEDFEKQATREAVEKTLLYDKMVADLADEATWVDTTTVETTADTSALSATDTKAEGDTTAQETTAADTTTAAE